MESSAIKNESQDLKQRCLITYARLFIIDFKLSMLLKKLDVPSLETTLRRQLTSAKTLSKSGCTFASVVIRFRSSKTVTSNSSFCFFTTFSTSN